MLRVGITGGIGSGKSTVCKAFAQLGIHIYDADSRTKELYASNETLRKAIVNSFGAEIFSGTEINKTKLAEIVFADPQKLQLLNSIVHPFVFEDYEAWCKGLDHEKYTIKEAAIMFESGSYKHLNYVVGVTAPEELRIARIMQRDGSTRDAILRRIQKQMPAEELISRCDFIIENDSEKSIVEQVLALHKTFLAL